MIDRYTTLSARLCSALQPQHKPCGPEVVGSRTVIWMDVRSCIIARDAWSPNNHTEDTFQCIVHISRISKVRFVARRSPPDIFVIRGSPASTDGVMERVWIKPRQRRTVTYSTRLSTTVSSLQPLLHLPLTRAKIFITNLSTRSNTVSTLS